jgi:DNA-binding transcriptional LysR family regulator
VPHNADALAQHHTLALHIAGREQGQPFVLQSRLDGARGMQLLPVQARFASSDFRALLDACVAGLGIAQLPQVMALPALRSGGLKVVLSDLAPDNFQLFIHYPSRKQLPARVRAFVDFCIEHFAGHADLHADLAQWTV